MANIIISLVSEQTIQNVIFIKSQPPADRYVFITTAHMERSGQSRSEWIENAAGISAERIVVVEDDLQDIEQRLSEGLQAGPEDQITVNLTGGTKIMSIGVYNYCQKFTDRIYYIPIGKNLYRTLTGANKSTDTEITYRVGVKEYLESYGVGFEANSPIKSEALATTFFEKFIGSNPEFHNILERLRVFWRGTRREVAVTSIESYEEQTQNEQGKQIGELSSFLEELSFEYAKTGYLDKKELEYLTGGWFEEYIFYKIKHTLNLPEHAIALGVKLKKNERMLDNDLDVVFTCNNALHVVECKTGMTDQGKVSNKLFTETVYKASALRKYFGLTVSSYLFTLSDLAPKKGEMDYSERAQAMNIMLKHRLEIIDKEAFATYLSNLKR